MSVPPDPRRAAPDPAALYDGAFFDEIGAWATRSAAVVVPIIADLLDPASVIDVGCGAGAWLAAWHRHGVADIAGLDGDYVRSEDLLIGAEAFRAVDLTAPPPIDRSFDLAMSLEVAEHLPASQADAFVTYLTTLAPVVLFSAAVPDQGGVGHVNEQWPAYWSDRFATHGYAVADVLRARIWADPAVAGFYAQNLLLFVGPDLDPERSRRVARAAALPLVATGPNPTGPDPTDAAPIAADPGPPRRPLALVHPDVLAATLDHARRPGPPASLSSLLRQLAPATRRAVIHRLDAAGTPGRIGLAAWRRTRRLVSRGRYEPGLPATAWVRSEANPQPADTLSSFRLFAVLGTWLEADIVESTVRNAFAQGCERVYLVDNDSPDDTVARAVAAGATMARTFATDSYDEARRMALMNDVVQQVSEQTAEEEGSEHIWWMWLDADELHQGPGGRTVCEYLETLDQRFRVVGARCFNHYPHTTPAHIDGGHPLDTQPMCEEQVYPMCSEGHRKHPLQRWDLGGAPITSSAGFHQAHAADEPLLEPATPIFLHHFPYRNEADTRHRLAMMVSGGEGRAAHEPETLWHMHRRAHSIDAIYAQHWSRVESLEYGGSRYGVNPRPWSELVGPADEPWTGW